MVVVAMLMTLLGIACGSTGNDQGSSSQESSDVEETAASDNTKAQTTQQGLSIGETAAFPYGDTVTLYSYTSPAQATHPEVWTPSPGSQYAVIDVEGCGGTQAVPDAQGESLTSVFSPDFFALQMPDNTRLEPTVGVVEPALEAVDIPAGKCVRGNVSFEVPQGVTPKSIELTMPYQTTQEGLAKWAVA